MIRRIRPPTCTVCEKLEARFQSEKWPGVLICHSCSSILTEWFIKFQLARNNPIFYEVCAPNPDCSDIYYIQSPISGYRAQQIPPMGSDSEIYFPRGLDILDDIWSSDTTNSGNITGPEDEYGTST